MASNTVRGGGKSKRGFASMSPEQQREIARQGGRAAHQKGVAHEFTSQEAQAAGRIGGRNSGARRGLHAAESLSGLGRSGSGRHAGSTQDVQREQGGEEASPSGEPVRGQEPGAT
jgi:hypothetical protein